MSAVREEVMKEFPEHAQKLSDFTSCSQRYWNLKETMLPGKSAIKIQRIGPIEYFIQRTTFTYSNETRVVLHWSDDL